MPADYALLPPPSAGGGSSHHSPSKAKRLQLFLKRRPLLTSFVSLVVVLSVYVTIFPSHPARVTSAVSSSWSGKPSTGTDWNAAGDDDDGWFSHIGGGGGSGGSKSSYAVDKAKCEQLWQDEGRVSGGGGQPAHGSTHAVESGPADDGTRAFSLEAEIRAGKTRKEALHEMVAKTKGYYVRDYPLWLGWNNIRYIIEASLLHAEMLDRTLVVPTHVIARACEFDKDTCAAFATQVNRGQAMQSHEWDDLPEEKQWAWLIPTELMLNIPHIRRSRPIMTVADYLLLHDIPASVEDIRGQWQRNGYHTTGAVLHVIPNRDYDTDLSRVDRMPAGARLLSEEEKALDPYAKAVRKVLEGKTVAEWDDVRGAVWDGQESDEDLEKKLNAAGAYILHTWQGSHGMEYVRTVTEPIKQVSLVEDMKGWHDDYNSISSEVLLLEGETHYWRKPGTLRFTTPAASQRFARLVLYDILPPTLLGEMAERLDERMRERVDGRTWRSAHMRRGDFVKHGWVMNADPHEHFHRIVKWMETARQTLVEIHTSGYVQKYVVPEATAAPEYLARDPPKKDDPFYLATDERNATFIEYYKEHGAVMIQDLLTAKDRREMDAWPLVFTDVLGVLEQTMLARASTFYGHALSSVSGGAVNHRATLGKDPRTTVID